MVHNICLLEAFTDNPKEAMRGIHKRSPEWMSTEPLTFSTPSDIAGEYSKAGTEQCRGAEVLADTVLRPAFRFAMDQGAPSPNFWRQELRDWADTYYGGAFAKDH